VAANAAEKRRRNMEQTQAQFAVIDRISPQDRESESMRIAQNNLLSELPGVVFGLLTVGYIVTSLLSF
jgi:hypothetical protein